MAGTFDVLIIGGSSAGAVLASRLSADGSRRVALLEAGSAYPPNLYPHDLANADIVGGPDGHDWGYTASTGLGDRSIRALRGKALGASSAVNAPVGALAMVMSLPPNAHRGRVWQHVLPPPMLKRRGRTGRERLDGRRSFLCILFVLKIGIDQEDRAMCADQRESQKVRYSTPSL